MRAMWQSVLLFVAFTPSASDLLRGHVQHDQERAALGDECHDWQHDADLLREVADKPVHFYANRTAKEAAVVLLDLRDSLKKSCFGKEWSGRDCNIALNNFRRATWPHLIREVGSDPHFAHLLSSKAPPVKGFSGGGFAAEVACRKDGKKSHFFFQHIYKCNGMNIKMNLAFLGHVPWKKAIDMDWWANQRCREYKEESDTPESSTPKPVMFTFVRDPIQKFIAGYKEIASRGLVDTMQGAKVGTKAHAISFLDNLFHGSCNNGHVALQVQSFVGTSCQSKFDFVGRLENFDHDWKRLGMEGGCDQDQPLTWPIQASHDSDTNDFGAEAAMQEALQANGGKLMISLCLWVLPDIVAFDYSLPPECAAHDLMHPLVS